MTVALRRNLFRYEPPHARCIAPHFVVGMNRPMPVALHRIFLSVRNGPSHCTAFFVGMKRPMPVALRRIFSLYETPSTMVADDAAQVKCLSLVVIPVVTTTLEDPHTKNDQVMTETLVSKKRDQEDVQARASQRRRLSK